mgnify:FL=1
MNFKNIHKTMMYDEFGKKDYQGYILFVLMVGYVMFMSLGVVGWVIYLSHFL